MRMRISASAEADLEEARDYYEQQSAGLGSRFIDEMEQALALLSKKPSLWKERLHGCRRVNCRRFPYYIIYRATEECVEIIAVAHKRRRPFYWRNRLLKN